MRIFHHTVNDQPVRQIMKQFENCARELQFRILRLTATLHNSNCKERHVEEEVCCLENTFLSTVNFPPRIHNNSITAIDNIFIDKEVKYENYSIHPLVNGLSDHDAQIIIINNITVVNVLTKLKA